LEKVAMRFDRKVLMEVDGKSPMIVDDLQGILGQQLRPCPIHLLLLIMNKLTSY
jgi:hypothetical protein